MKNETEIKVNDELFDKRDDEHLKYLQIGQKREYDARVLRQTEKINSVKEASEKAAADSLGVAEKFGKIVFNRKGQKRDKT